MSRVDKNGFVPFYQARSMKAGFKPRSSRLQFSNDICLRSEYSDWWRGRIGPFM